MVRVIKSVAAQRAGRFLAGRRIAGVFALLLAGSGPTTAQVEDPLASLLNATEKAEYLAAIDEEAKVIEVCDGDRICFVERAGPFGPAHLLPGEPYASSHVEVTDRLQNFAFGFLGQASNVDARSIANDFHCGPPCAERRRSELFADLAAATKLAAEFDAAGLKVFALWPDARFGSTTRSMGRAATV